MQTYNIVTSGFAGRGLNTKVLTEPPLSSDKTKFTYAQLDNILNAGPLRQKQPTNKLKIRILYETSILHLIFHASVILTVGLHL